MVSLSETLYFVVSQNGFNAHGDTIGQLCQICCSSKLIVTCLFYNMLIDSIQIHLKNGLPFIV